MATKYHCTTKSRIYTSILLGSGPLFVMLPMLIEGSVMLPVAVGLCGLLLANGSYFVLENDAVISVTGFLFSTKVPFEKIRKIKKEGVRILHLAPAIIIEYQTSLEERSKLQMSIGLYGEPTAGKFLRDLYSLHPNLSFDEDCKSIMERAPAKAMAEEKRSWSVRRMGDDVVKTVFPDERKN